MQSLESACGERFMLKGTTCKNLKPFVINDTGGCYVNCIQGRFWASLPIFTPVFTQRLLLSQIKTDKTSLRPSHKNQCADLIGNLGRSHFYLSLQPVLTLAIKKQTNAWKLLHVVPLTGWGVMQLKLLKIPKKDNSNVLQLIRTELVRYQNVIPRYRY